MSYFVLLLSLMLAALPARAQPPVELQSGRGLLCDSAAQIERFMAVFAGDADAAVAIVNAEAEKTNACGVDDVLYRREQELGTVKHGEEVYRVVQISVIGVQRAGRVIPLPLPQTQFTIVKIKSHGA